MRRFLVFPVLCVCALALAGAAPIPADRNEQTMIYDVYAGGIHVLEAKLHIDLSAPGRYGVILAAQTYGFLASLVPWRGTFESYGWITKSGAFRPETHRSYSVSSDETELKEYKYGRDGKFLGLQETETKKGKILRPRKKKNAANDYAIAQGTTDALSAALEVLAQVGRGGACEGAAAIFDGKRSFREIFRQKDSEDLKASAYNVFQGTAVICEVEVKPLKGEWSKKPRGWLSIQEQGRQAGALPSLWAGKLRDDGPAVPAKIRIKTSYGTLMMHLAEYRAGDKILVAKRRKR